MPSKITTMAIRLAHHLRVVIPGLLRPRSTTLRAPPPIRPAMGHPIRASPATVANIPALTNKGPITNMRLLRILHPLVTSPSTRLRSAHRARPLGARRARRPFLLHLPNHSSTSKVDMVLRRKISPTARADTSTKGLHKGPTDNRVRTAAVTNIRPRHRQEVRRRAATRPHHLMGSLPHMEVTVNKRRNTNKVITKDMRVRHQTDNTVHMGMRSNRLDTMGLAVHHPSLAGNLFYLI